MRFTPDLDQGWSIVTPRGRRRIKVLAALVVGALAALWLGMLHSPEPNWDEGWTLTVARTWVERGIYGQVILGEPTGPGLPASFLTVGPIALAFRVLGVGFWQGRMATALLTLAALGALALLARRLYGAVVGLAVVPTLLLTTIHATGNPLYMGRQAMGEPAMLLALILAYLALTSALVRPWPWAVVAMLLGGLALVAKDQPTPFWIVSLLAPVPLLLWRRRWRGALTLVAVLAGSLAVARLINGAWALAIAGRVLPNGPIEGLTRTVALVLEPSSRRLALEFSALVGVPALLGMAWAAWHLLRGLPHAMWDDPRQIVRLALLAFLSSWYAWFLLLAVGWVRYLYPVVFLGAIFAAAMLAAWTGDFSPREIRARLGEGGAAGRTTLVALTILVIAPPAALFHLAYTYPLTGDWHLRATSAWLNQRLPADAVIETNETELFVYLDRPYHYPPEQVHVVANQRLILGEEVAFPYDPLTANPDYLVTGRMEAWWALYQPAIEAGAFRPVQSFGQYTIYERVRAEAP